MSNSATPCTVAHQTPLSMGFPRQKHWSGQPIPFPGDLPEPGIKPASPALAGGFFTTELPGKPTMEYYTTIKRIKLCHLQQHEWTWSEVSQTETNTV